MRFLVDAQLPPLMSGEIRAWGHQADHLYDLGMRTASDSVVWERAVQDGSVIVTKDEDFASRVIRTKEGPAVLWIRIGNTGNPELFRRLREIWGDLVECFESGERLVEVV